MTRGKIESEGFRLKPMGALFEFSSKDMAAF